MPKIAAPLTDIQVKNAKPKEKAYKLADCGGMYLEVTPTCSKLWQKKFRQANGSECRLAFGTYPEVSLAEAREKRLEARKQIAQGSTQDKLDVRPKRNQPARQHF
ncbi:Arm DNA-binding domain-containing protein [Undibacterium crateris]|uniref:Arm DNA-binding domain-containing protein n=1 Tax=Undibacterium crateris TaxID=2528175 RepID=UPI0013898CD5|nr:Arm DNA-binding domain-containing protein [Undibacterium crateris]NDI84090.1 integrase arm-type DNA-binding domain-containing protein [Undibacterium crateris]